jgi:hypothetical protein
MDLPVDPPERPFERDGDDDDVASFAASRVPKRPSESCCRFFEAFLALGEICLLRAKRVSQLSCRPRANLFIWRQIQMNENALFWELTQLEASVCSFPVSLSFFSSSIGIFSFSASSSSFPSASFH